jgi:hypothetical protein
MLCYASFFFSICLARDGGPDELEQSRTVAACRCWLLAVVGLTGSFLLLFPAFFFNTSPTSNVVVHRPIFLFLFSLLCPILCTVGGRWFLGIGQSWDCVPDGKRDTNTDRYTGDRRQLNGDPPEQTSAS